MRNTLMIKTLTRELSELWNALNKGDIIRVKDVVNYLEIYDGLASDLLINYFISNRVTNVKIIRKKTNTGKFTIVYQKI
jgi:hypothetical protein